MRITVDIQDPLFRRVKSVAASKGPSLKAFKHPAVIHEMERQEHPAKRESRRAAFPLAASNRYRKTMPTNDRIHELLDLTFQSHGDHSKAKTWIETIDSETIVFCRQTQQGFLRLATNEKTFGADAVTLKAAWRLYEEIRPDSRVAFLPEPEEMEIAWKTPTELAPPQKKSFGAMPGLRPSQSSIRSN